MNIHSLHTPVETVRKVAVIPLTYRNSPLPQFVKHNNYRTSFHRLPVSGALQAALSARREHSHGIKEENEPLSVKWARKPVWH
ncbi:hypothetical protein J6590_002658 [Homalodisca vitripennis]|nr:hypothetical protein J6590_002658 [Homalodisca vitripennis]